MEDFFDFVFEDLALLLEDFALPFDFELFEDFAEEERALDFAFVPLFFAAGLDLAADFPLFFAAFFVPPLLVSTFTFFATAFTAFFAVFPEEREPAARPANAPITPPTTAPTGPAMLPSTAPVAAPAVCFEIGGMSMFSDDEPDVSVDF
ncbi:MAG: hypothetical protein M3N12_09060 [Verrucomicrobiota bacterium]|nr:hypothetical protein [Verrucomicrobiota bacterium]